MKLFVLFAVLIFPFTSNAQKTSSLELPTLIGDNMVLQQSTSITVWGKAIPGKSISIITDWNAQGNTVTDATGHWTTNIITPKAGGPYTIQISSGDTTITLKNVMVGEVWFCSGQSNMEMPLAGWPPHDTVMHSKDEIAAASRKLLDSLQTNAAPRNRAEETAKARARAAISFTK